MSDPQNMQRYLRDGIVLGLFGAVASWLFVTYAPDGGWDFRLENLWRLVHIPAWIVAVLIDGNPHGGGAGPGLFGVFLQWFAVGFIGSWFWKFMSGGATAGST